MRLSPLAALVWAASATAVLGSPVLDERDPPAVNGSMATPEGFEVVIVYVRPNGGACPAMPSACPGSPDVPELPAPTTKPKPSPGEGTYEKPDKTGTFTHAGPIATIKPAVHWGCDTRPATNVIPISSDKPSNLYYGVDDPTKEGHFAFLNYYFKTPSVNLDHCAHIKVVEYSAGGLTITFLTHEAYNNALNTWVADEEIILVTYTEGCGDYDKGERCYFKVKALDFTQAGLVIRADGSPCDPSDIIHKAETEWGWWIPRHGGVDAPPASSSSSVLGGSISATTVSGSSPSSSAADGASSSYTPGASFSWSGAPTSTYSGVYATGTGSSSSDVDTSGFKAPKGDCTPPADDKYGLPTACLGDLFDSDLDDGLGYQDMPQKYLDFIVAVAPGINDAGGVPEQDGSLADLYDRRRSLAVSSREFGRLGKRCSWWPCSTVQKYVVEPIKQGYQAVQKATSISGSINKDISWKLPDASSSDPNAKQLKDPNAKQVVSPWGDSILLKAFGTQGEDSGDKKLTGYMNVFCVGCGVSGSAKIAGKAAWSPVGMAFTQGEVDIHVDAQFVLKLGIDAQMKYQNDFSTTLLEVGLPGLSYGVVTIGPAISVGAHVVLEAEAKGKLLAGAEMGLANAHVLIDFVNPSKCAKDGWDPYFKPVFEAEGEIMLSASLGLPIGLKCGLKIASWDKSISVIDEPSVKGVAQVAASVGLADGKFTAGFKETNGCTGISTQISWRNKLWIDLFGIQQIPLLDSLDKPLAQSCIKLPGLPAAPSNPEATPTPVGDGSETTPTPAAETPAADPPVETPAADPVETPAADPPAADPPASDPPAADPPAADPPAADPPAADPPVADPPAADPPAEDPPSERRRFVYARNTTAPTNTTTTTTNSTVIDLTSKVKSNSTGNELSYAPQGVPNSPYNDTTGYEYSLMVDPTATTMVVSCSNGNLYAFAVDGEDNAYCSEMWATFRDVLVADGSQRLLHYYNNTMAKLGVSRVRVEDETDIPLEGVPFAFIPYSADDPTAANADDENYMYLAVDVAEQIFYPVACDFADSAMGSKIFLVADPVKGVDTLLSPEVKYTVTGGDVKHCSALVLMQGKYDDDMSYAKAAPTTDADLDYDEGWDA